MINVYTVIYRILLQKNVILDHSARQLSKYYVQKIRLKKNLARRWENLTAGHFSVCLLNLVLITLIRYLSNKPLQPDSFPRARRNATWRAPKEREERLSARDRTKKPPPDEPLNNFSASKSVDRQILCSSGTSCDGFQRSKIEKGLVGHIPYLKCARCLMFG